MTTGYIYIAGSKRGAKYCNESKNKENKTTKGQQAWKIGYTKDLQNRFVDGDKSYKKTHISDGYFPKMAWNVENYKEIEKDILTTLNENTNLIKGKKNEFGKGYTEIFTGINLKNLRVIIEDSIKKLTKRDVFEPDLEFDKKLDFDIHLEKISKFLQFVRK